MPLARSRQATWKAEGITAHVALSDTDPTGAAYIFVSDETGENAIIVVPGAADHISVADVEAARGVIEGAKVFVTQLEQPIPAARRGLEIARAAGVITLFNPAPAAPLPDDIYPLCDYVIPNETEAKLLTGIPVDTLDDARKAGDAFLAKGVGTALITLGLARRPAAHARPIADDRLRSSAGKVLETTGAGDSFVGAFAAGLADGMTPADAARFGCAAAGISVTRLGTAPAMPTRAEIEALLKFK